MKKLAPILTVVTISFSLSPSKLMAVDLSSLKRCAVSMYNKAQQKIYDPWTKAAMELDIVSMKQTIQNSENIVVAPLWKFKDSENPISDLASQLDDIKASGATTIYFPPMYVQMLYDFFGSPNIHGYWPKSFDLKTVDPKLGKSEDYLTLLQKLLSQGYQLALDIVPRHIGYAPKDGNISLWGKDININDPKYFAQTRDLTPLDYSEVALKGPEASHLLTDMRPWGLPYLNLENTWIRGNMIAEHVKAVDMGFTSFRIDSAKHMRSDYIHDLMTAMINKGKEKGVSLKFILEYFSGNYGELAYKLHEIGALPGLMFIDFRMAGSLREAIVDGNSFGKIKESMEALEELQLDQGFLIQAITDQDGYYRPIYHGNPETENKTYGMMILSHMTSTNRPYYVSGIEQPESPEAVHGTPKKFFDQSSPIAAQVSRINNIMNSHFHLLKPFSSHDILNADNDKIIIRREYKDSSAALLMVIDRSYKSVHINKAKADFKPTKDLFRWGEFGSNVETYLAEIPLK